MKLHSLQTLFLSAVLLTTLNACVEEEADTFDVDEVIQSSDGTIKTVTLDEDYDQYDFYVTGDSGVYELEDDIRDISITGDSNYITIMEDDIVEYITITGDNNVVLIDSAIATEVYWIIVSGDSNTVTVGSFQSSEDSGDDNQISAINES